MSFMRSLREIFFVSSYPLSKNGRISLFDHFLQFLVGCRSPSWKNSYKIQSSTRVWLMRHESLISNSVGTYWFPAAFVFGLYISLCSPSEFDCTPSWPPQTSATAWNAVFSVFWDQRMIYSCALLAQYFAQWLHKKRRQVNQLVIVSGITCSLQWEGQLPFSFDRTWFAVFFIPAMRSSSSCFISGREIEKMKMTCKMV